MGEMRNAFKILVKDLGIGGRILGWILGKEGGEVWTGYISLRIGKSGGLF
jgi:hypothetical protein